MKLKITVHTKTGKKLSYYADWDNDAQAKNFWMRAVGNDTVSFGRFTMASSNIDFVEIA